MSEPSRRLMYHMLILAGALGIIALVPINTDIGYGHIFTMGAALAASVILPYVITTHGLKERVITFPFRQDANGTVEK